MAHLDSAHSAQLPSASIPSPGEFIQPSRWQRLMQYQPSKRLVKLVFWWWLVVCVCTALIMTNGLGISSLSALIPFSEFGLTICILSMLMGLIVVAIDVLCLINFSQPSQFAVRRHYPNNVPVFKELDIHAVLSLQEVSSANTSGIRKLGLSIANLVREIIQKLGFINALNVQFYDDYPDQLMPIGIADNVSGSPNEAMPIAVTIPLTKSSQNHSILNNAQHSQTHAQMDIFYPVLAVKRGTGFFWQSHLKVSSPFGLFTRQFTLIDTHAHAKPLRVLADFSGLLNNELSAVFEKSIDAGIQALLRQGQGSDFLKLREYSAGDAIRQIDWKASSRINKLMSKTFDDDNDQDVVFLLDCGEQMRHQDTTDLEEAMTASQGRHTQSDNLTGRADNTKHHIHYFDRVLNAVLLLAYVANKQGDAVGLMTFAGQDVYLPVKKGGSLIRHFLNATADLSPTLETSDYLVASQTLLKRLKKRSLVIVISNTRTEASFELTQAMHLLARRHQVVFANLTEEAVQVRLAGELPPQNFDDALLYHSLQAHADTRQRLHENLSQTTGTLCLQTTARQLPLKLIQTYLSLKRGG